MSEDLEFLEDEAGETSCLALAGNRCHEPQRRKTKRYEDADFLTAEQELVLIKLYQDTHDKKYLAEIVSSYMPFITSIAYKNYAINIPHEDQLHEGVIGLIEAIDRFDVKSGVRLSTFSRSRVSNKMLLLIYRNYKIVRLPESKPLRKAFWNINRMKIKLRSNQPDICPQSTLKPCEVEKIAQELDINASAVTEVELYCGQGDRFMATYAHSEDQTQTNDFDIDTSLGPEDVLRNRQSDWMISSALPEAMGMIDDRLKRIISARYPMEDDVRAMTLGELGKELGCSAERVRQLEAKAFLEMRKAIESLQSATDEILMID